MRERNVDTPDFIVDDHAVRLERILCRATQHRSRTHVELRTAGYEALTEVACEVVVRRARTRLDKGTDGTRESSLHFEPRESLEDRSHLIRRQPV